MTAVLAWLLAGALLLAAWLGWCLHLAHREWREETAVWEALCSEISDRWEQACRRLLKEQRAGWEDVLAQVQGEDWRVPGA